MCLPGPEKGACSGVIDVFKFCMISEMVYSMPEKSSGTPLETKSGMTRSSLRLGSVGLNLQDMACSEKSCLKLLGQACLNDW